MPIIPELINTFDKLKELHKRKNDDYAVEGDPFSNFTFSEWFTSFFKKPRDIVYAVILGIKFARLANLLNKNGEAKNEPVEDTFDDIIVYTAIWKSDYMERRKKREIGTDVAEKKANTV